MSAIYKLPSFKPKTSIFKIRKLPIIKTATSVKIGKNIPAISLNFIKISANFFKNGCNGGFNEWIWNWNEISRIKNTNWTNWRWISWFVLKMNDLYVKVIFLTIFQIFYMMKMLMVILSWIRWRCMMNSLSV